METVTRPIDPRRSCAASAKAASQLSRPQSYRDRKRSRLSVIIRFGGMQNKPDNAPAHLGLRRLWP
jgi:hypothetical protein